MRVWVPVGPGSRRQFGSLATQSHGENAVSKFTNYLTSWPSIQTAVDYLASLKGTS